MPKFIIGRDASCDIVINDPSVSRRHAELLIENNQAQVRDLGSSNGTMVNGVRIASPQMLNDYDILKVAGSLVPWKNYLDGNSSSAIYSESLVSSVGAQPQNYGYEENLLKQRLPNATLVLLLGLLSFYLPLIVFVGILMFLGLAAIIILVVPPILGLLISIATLVVASKNQKVFFENTSRYTGYASLNVGVITSVISLLLSTIFLIISLLALITVSSSTFKKINILNDLLK